MRLRVIVPAALALALVTTAATTLVNRPYAAGLTGETGCATDENNPFGLCRDMRPQGGFPLIHISDKREGPNPGKLGPEDDIYPVSIAGNVAGYTALWLAIVGAISLLAGRRRAAPDAEETPPAPPPVAAPAAAEPEGAPAAAPPPTASAEAVPEPAPAAAKPENAPPG